MYPLPVQRLSSLERQLGAYCGSRSGQHTEEILEEIGMNASDRQKLKDAGITV